MKDLSLTNEQEIIFKENENLIYHMLKKISFDYTDYALKEDLIQEGRISLCKAIKTFDINMNNQFNTYACSIIYHNFLYFLRTYKEYCISYDDENTHIDINNYGFNNSIDDNNYDLSYLLKDILKDSSSKETLGIYAIFMKSIYGKTQEEIAKEKGVSLPTVKKSVAFAKKSLKSNDILKSYLSNKYD